MRGVWLFLCWALFLCLLPAGAVRAQWVVAESPHFRLHQRGAPAEAAAQVRQLEEFHAFLVSLTGGAHGTGPVSKLDLFVVETLAEALPGAGLSPGIRGFYRPTPGGIAVFARADSMGRSAGHQAVLLHEYAHHFLVGDRAHAYPAWYVEGFAEYFGTARFLPRRIEYGRVDRARLAWLLKGAWLPPEEVLRWRGEARGPRPTSMLYAQSWLMTHWLLRTPGGPERLTAYLVAVTQGADPVAAFTTHVDPDLETLNARLKDYFESPRWANFTQVRRQGPLEVEVRLAALPPSADRLLLPTVAILQGVTPEEGSRLLAEMRAEANRSDPFAARALSLAEARHGDPAVALELLTGLLEKSPSDADLLRWRGEARLRADGHPFAARQDFRAAFTAEPTDWRAMVAYVRTFPPRGLDAERLALLERGWELAPQVKDTGLMLAQALVLNGRGQEAARIVQPILFSPHGLFQPPAAAWLAPPAPASR